MRKLITILMVVVVATCGAVYFFSSTTLGLKSLLYGIDFILPGQLRFAQVEGKLVSPIRFQGVIFQTKQMELSIDQVDVDWSLLSVLKDGITINHLNVTGLKVSVKQDKAGKSKATEPGASNLSWLNWIHFKKVQLQDAHIDAGLGSILAIKSLEINHQTTLYQAVLKGTFGAFPLSADVNVDYQDNQVAIQKMAVSLANATILGSGTIGEKWHIKWQVNIPEVNHIVPVATGSLMTQGEIKGLQKNPTILADFQSKAFTYQNIKLDYVQGNIVSNAQTEKAQATIIAKQISFNGYGIPHATLIADALNLKNKMIVNLKLNINEKNKAIGELQLPPFALINAHSAVIGQFQVRFDQLLNFITSPYISQLQGVLHSDLKIAGRINAPKLDVKATLKDGQVHIPKLKITLKNIELDADYQSNHPLQFKGHFISGNGNADINGNVNLTQDGLPVMIHVLGKDLLLANLSEYKVIVSPTLTLTQIDHKIDVAGEINIPEAKIAPKDYSSVTTLPDEVVIVDQQKSTETMPTNLSLNVRVTLGEKIKFVYQNLHAQLKGSVLIAEKAGSPPIGTGELYTVNGKYSAYGQDLKITQGRLIYAGNALTNPGLDIRALKKMENITLTEVKSQFNSSMDFKPIYQGAADLSVGVWVKGTLDKPTVGLYSDPVGLDQNDILSYLVFGVPRAKVKDLGMLAQLNHVASGLNSGPSKVATITNKVQKVFGLTELSMGSVETFNAGDGKKETNTTVNIEKKIGKNLSIHYRVGVFNPVSVLNLKYQINKRLAIQTETSSFDTGADLLFEFERD
ncbi:MAG: translocation/assembly module TamB domain-containing protein [Gammaproteobacteria bacterium]|nr:translocation/assembly module TamB domain-containing protein [Gammaproteobacteria bacterium]